MPNNNYIATQILIDPVVPSDIDDNKNNNNTNNLDSLDQVKAILDLLKKDINIFLLSRDRIIRLI